MISRLFIVTLFVLAGLGTSGCFSFGRKAKEPKAPKEAKISGTPVSDMEKDFKVRWILTRAAELTGRGMAEAEAKAQAESEYATTYKYTKPGK